mmetsp:Transcript_61029/g.134257  ORF Transcript_61029/g.134257 Transcript_61029/m.134257 type:complete len:308 (+) Transcript_61029:340-1263(+)
MVSLRALSLSREISTVSAHRNACSVSSRALLTSACKALQEAQSVEFSLLWRWTSSQANRTSASARSRAISESLRASSARQVASSAARKLASAVASASHISSCSISAPAAQAAAGGGGEGGCGCGAGEGVHGALATSFVPETRPALGARGRALGEPQVEGACGGRCQARKRPPPQPPRRRTRTSACSRVTAQTRFLNSLRTGPGTAARPREMAQTWEASFLAPGRSCSARAAQAQSRGRSSFSPMSSATERATRASHGSSAGRALARPPHERPPPPPRPMLHKILRRSPLSSWMSPSSSSCASSSSRS